MVREVDGTAPPNCQASQDLAGFEVAFAAEPVPVVEANEAPEEAPGVAPREHAVVPAAKRR